jgi:alpha-beta hydrolase superfamily lysophospholipase
MLASGVTFGHDVETAAADGVRLRASFLSPGKQGLGCVLLLHGVADSRGSTLGFARILVAAGYSVLAPDSRGHGASGGELVTYGLLEREDVLRWAAWLRARGCQVLYGLGESMGAAILIQAASEQPVFAAIVAECPFSDLRTIAEERVVQALPGPKLLRRALARIVVPSGFLYARVRYGCDLRDVAPVAAAARMKTPALLIHGTADTNIPPVHSGAILAAGSSVSLWLVPGAGHTAASAYAPLEFKERVLKWFELHRPD